MGPYDGWTKVIDGSRTLVNSKITFYFMGGRGVLEGSFLTPKEGLFSITQEKNL